MKQRKHLNIALVMGYNAGKIGSLERFLFHFTEEAIARGHKVSMVFIEQPIEEVSSTLESKGAPWDSAPMLCKRLSHAGFTLYHLSLNSARFFCNLLKSRSALAAENPVAGTIPCPFRADS